MNKIVNGKIVRLSDEEVDAIRKEWLTNDSKSRAIDYIEKRKLAYPPVGDQLDLIYKGFVEMSKTQELPAPIIEWVDAITEVKTTYPSPAEEVSLSESVVSEEK